MSDKEDPNKKKEENPRPMSRREFTRSSMAVIGAYSMMEGDPPPPLSAEAEAIKLEKSEPVRDILEIRHILDEDIKRVLEHAEKTGRKLYQPERNRFLSKLRVGETYFYVEYSPLEGGYRIHTAYAHRFLLEGDPK